MPILVDYRCGACDLLEERWVASPPPAEPSCAVCGGSMRRKWVPVGLHGGGGEPAAAADQPAAPKPSLCSRYPQIPGLCHMSESAGRAWVARYLGDNRAAEREQQRQEERAVQAQRAPTMEDAITTHHYPANHHPKEDNTACHPESSTARS